MKTLDCRGRQGQIRDTLFEIYPKGNSEKANLEL